ncbi:MAG: DUF192 domain-containing protein, partial [Candidatus Micrarchaeota archaeon]|nr:DUF192 domain-containing protein [Candidatus Micrarchaeota archaeon]
QMTIKGKQFGMMIAKSSAQKMVGLMYREQIREDEGMLFLFSSAGKWKIWMLNMRFPIDVLWLDKSGMVVHIEQDLKPCTGIFSCPSFAPSTDARYVVELCAGTAQKLGITTGDVLEVPKW